MSDDLRARAHNFVAYFEQQLRSRLRTEERAALERIIAAKFGFDDDALRAAVEAERAEITRLREVQIDTEIAYQTALRAAVEAEREACAQVGSLWGADCAEAIRARKP